MSAVEELADLIRGIDGPSTLGGLEVAEGIIDAGYFKPREVVSRQELRGLSFGTAVRTSDSTDTVVLRSSGGRWTNQDGYDISDSDLWDYGSKPFHVIYEPAR